VTYVISHSRNCVKSQDAIATRTLERKKFRIFAALIENIRLNRNKSLMRLSAKNSSMEGLKSNPRAELYSDYIETAGQLFWNNNRY
jgi:hypothetical protein